MKKTAYCKINITLEILGKKRNDGFHDIASVMKKLPFGDEVCLEVNDEGTIHLSCDKDVCDEKSNLAYLAAEKYLCLYNSRTGENKGADITLIKKTPTGAGLGGGSADGAAVLDLLTQQLGIVTETEVYDIACKLGSDVPFCLERHNLSLCTGRGEIVTELKGSLPHCFCLVAKPENGLDTKGIYAEYDGLFGEDYTKNSSFALAKSLETGISLCDIKSLAVNDFQSLCVSRLPEIDGIVRQMYSCGAAVAQMSGSGSAVFGLFEEKSDAKECQKLLSDKNVAESFIVEFQT